jgi:hypothetical protein
MPGPYQIAEFNIARVVSALTDPVMKEFVDNLDRVNALAEASEGFVWRLKDDATGDATVISVFDDPEIIVNLSVWEDIDALKSYVYRSHHASFLTRRKEWFNLMRQPYFVMWWIRSGYLPDIEEAKERLEHFRGHGNTPYAFNTAVEYDWRDADKYKQ